MSCEACRTTIAGALEALPGVVAVGVDLDRRLVLVEHDARLTAPDRLATAVEDQGYELAVRAVP